MDACYGVRLPRSSPTLDRSPAPLRGAPPLPLVPLVLLVALGLGLSACSRPRSAPTSEATSIEQLLAQNAQQHGIPGQAVLVLRDGQVVFRGSHGLADREAARPASPDDVFAVFSVSKLFVSTLVLQAVDQGRLALDAPIGRYLPDLPERWRSLLVLELLDHTSGLPEYYDPTRTPVTVPATREAALAAIAGWPLQFAPGTQTRYTQTNYLLLGALLEALHGKPYRQIVEEQLVRPLGLAHTYLGRDHVPAGQLPRIYLGKDGQLAADAYVEWSDYAITHAELFTTLDDLGAFLSAVIGGRVVKRETLLAAWAPHRMRDGSTGGFAAGWDYGETAGYRHVGHDGGVKVRVRILYDPAGARATWVIVYLTNGSADNVWTRKLVESVEQVVAREGLR